MKLKEELDSIVSKALDLKEQEETLNSKVIKDNDLTQCVIKIEDIGNEYKYLGMVEDNSNYASEYDMENHFIDRLDGEDPTIQFVLAYHHDGQDDKFYDEDGDELDLDMEEQEQFEKAYQDAINSKDNTVIPDKGMIESADYIDASTLTTEEAKKAIEALDYILSTYGGLNGPVDKYDLKQIKILKDAKELLKNMIPELQNKKNESIKEDKQSSSKICNEDFKVGDKIVRYNPETQDRMIGIVKNIENKEYEGKIQPFLDVEFTWWTTHNGSYPASFFTKAKNESINENEVYFVCLDGEPVSPDFDTKKEAVQWAETNYDIDDDRVSIESETTEFSKWEIQDQMNEIADELMQKGWKKIDVTIQADAGIALSKGLNELYLTLMDDGKILIEYNHSETKEINLTKDEFMQGYSDTISKIINQSNIEQ